MLRILFPTRINDISPEDALERANKYIRNAHKEGNPTKALKFTNNAKSLLKDAEYISASKKIKDPSLSEGIANAYHEHGRLLDDLGHHGKAKKSHRKAEEWGYVDSVSRHTGPSHPLDKSDTIRQSLSPTVALSIVPDVTAVIYQDSSMIDIKQLNHQDHTLQSTPAKVDNGEPSSNKDVVHIPQKIFDQNITPPIAKYTLPEPNGWITSTPQLAYCLSLLHPSMTSKEELDQNECDWSQSRVDDIDEQERLQSMATDVIKAFVQEGLKKPNAVAEVVSLAAVLGQEDFRKLLQAFVDGINQSVLLDVHLLNVLTQLIQNSPRGYIDADDLVKILELLNPRLKDTHKQSTQNTYQFAMTVSQVLDSMVDSQVEGLSREQLHEPLSDYLKGLQQGSDPYLIYQAAYAYQALQYIPDDETILQSMMRRTGKVVQGISGAVSAVKALDLMGFIEGLHTVQQSFVGAEKAIGLVDDACPNPTALAENGQELLTSFKKWLNFSHKSSWYPALRSLDRLVQEGRFADFEKLVREVPCQHDPIFRWGVCQRLGEIAANPIWDLNTRKCAVDFLRQLYKGDASRSQQGDIKQWILYILNQLAESSKDIVEGSTQELLQETQANSSFTKRVLYHEREGDNPVLNLIMVTPPSTESPLLDRVQNKPDIETSLHQLRLERLIDRGGDVYISPRAKATQRATDDFDLTAKVQEFLTCDGKVFLILGDSGAGKSMFNKALEISLWYSYHKINGRIPLFIHLPTIENPERDLIAKRLRKANFTESQISELKLYREFILICDGYDESQQTRNLYMSNQLNQPGQWRAQMVISCRTEYIGVDYKHIFQPTDRNNGGGTRQFKEAIISPFTKEQIQDYIEQYVSLQKPPWKLQDYLQALEQIPNLQDLVKNPFLLKLSLELLPQLSKTNTKFSSTHITRVQLYDEFIAQWIHRGNIRLGEMELSSSDRSTFKRMTESGFQELGITYLKELVTAIYENQNGNPMVHYSEHNDQRTWKEAFFSERDGCHLLREVIPLTRNGNQYQLIHRSLMEYGLSLAVFGPSNRNWDTEAIPLMSRRGNTRSILSFQSALSTEIAGTADDKSLLDSPLGKRNLVGEHSVLQFLAERVQQEPVFKDQLHLVIERSKTYKMARIAAANAITILVRAGVQFNGADLRNVQIPGADLSFGVFDSAQFEGADLRKVNLRSVWMRQTNLRGAWMKGVQFGELPFLQQDSEVEYSVYSPNGKMYAAGLGDGSINLYETSSWNRIQRLEGHNDRVNNISFSSTGDRIASGSRDSTVRLWDVDTGECIHTLQGHSLGVSSVVYSPKGDQIASGSEDKTVQLWDAVTGECVHTLQGHIWTVNSVAYSPKGDLIASGSEDKAVRLWDADTGECIHTLQGHSLGVSSVVYSPKGDQIASGSEDKTVRLWDAVTGECVHTLQGHSNYVNCVIYSPNGDRIASGSDDWTVRLWNVDTGECVHTLKGHRSSVNNVVYSPRRNRIASGSSDCTVRFWDVDTGECVHTLQGHRSSVNNVAYSPKGDQIASGSSDRTVRLWDVDIGERVHTLQGHSGWINSVVYSPKGDRIASGSEDGTARFWDVDTGECVHTLQGHRSSVNNVAYSPKGDQIASGSLDSTVRLWGVDTGECVDTFQDHTWAAGSITYLPNGDRIASGNRDKAVRLWDVNTGKCLHALQGHSGNINSVVCSPKGDQIASGSRDSTVRLWDVDTGKCIHTLQGHSDYVNCVIYSPNGDWIASGSDDWTVRLWNVDTGECVHILQGHDGCVRSVVYSPRGDQVASGSNDRTVWLWDVDTGECVHSLQGHRWIVNSVTYSPKGDKIASGSDDSAVRLWDVDTGECVHNLQGHIWAVNSVAYSPKGDLIASGSEDRTVRLWDVDTGGCVHILQGHGFGVNNVVYSPGGDQIASGSDDSTVRLWSIDTGKCIRTFCDRSGDVNSIVYSPKGDRIAFGGSEHAVQLWDVTVGKCVRTLQDRSWTVNTVVYSPKGDRIASGSEDKTVRLWDADTGECIHTLQGHSGKVNIVVYSPGGDQIASGSRDSTVRLWDVNTGECIHTLQGHSGKVNIVVYSPGGDQIASGSGDSTVRLWDVNTGECIHALQGHGHDVNSVVYSPKGGRIASGSRDSTVRLWDADTGECIHNLQGHSDHVRSVVYSLEGDIVASGSNDKTVKLWDVESGQCLATISGFNSGVSSIALEGNFDAQYLVTGSLDKSVRRWRITEERVGRKAVLCWSSSHEVLTVNDLSFEDVRDLSQLNRELLIQRGSLVPKY